jgi:rod shape-determining protein MreD
VRLTALYAAATLLALWLQIELAQWLPLGPLVPDLAVILVVDLGLRQHDGLAPLLAFAIGYALDAFSGAQLGLNAFSLTLIYLLIYELARHAWMMGAVIEPLLVGVATILHSGCVLALGNGLASLWPPPARLLHAIILQALIGILLAPLAFRLLAGCRRLLRLPARVAQE